MKIVVLWLCWSASIAQANQARTLQATVTRAKAHLGVKMTLGGGGVHIDDIVAYVKTHAPDEYASHADEQSLQEQIHKMLAKEKDITTKTIAGQRKYFHGEMYDLKEIVQATLNNTSLAINMEQRHGGVTMDEIIAAFKTRYPNIYRLYTNNEQENEHGLRSVIGKKMRETMAGMFFIAEIPMSYSSFPLRKYFWGKEPDLSAVFSSVFSLPALLSRMQWQTKGISMDELIAQIKHAQPDVYDYYVQATREKEEWWLHRQLYRVLADTIEPLLTAKIKDDKATTPSTWLTEARVFSITATNKEGNPITKVFYGLPSDLEITVASKFGQQQLQRQHDKHPELTALQALLHDSLISRQVNLIPVLREAASSLASAMQLEMAGVSLDDAVAKVKEIAPDVYALYRRAAYDSSEEGLRLDLSTALAVIPSDTEPLAFEPTFTLTIPDTTPAQHTTKYFLHATAQLSNLLPELVSKLDRSRTTAAGIAKVILADYYDHPPSAASFIFREALQLPPQPITLNDSQDTGLLRHIAHLYRHTAGKHDLAFQLLQQAVAVALKRSVEENKLIVINPASAPQYRKYAVAE